MARKWIFLRMARYWLVLMALIGGAWAVPARAAPCVAPGEGGTLGIWAGSTYCWFDFTTYDDTLARSPSGQTISYPISDGSTITFTIRVTGSSLSAATSPLTGDSAIGNSAFIGITGKPLLVASGGVATLTFSNISYIPVSASGSSLSGTTDFLFVAADGESTNTGESISYTTNGGGWETLNQITPVSGTVYPVISNTGSTFTETGVSGTVGSYVIGSKTPTTITTTIDATAGTQAVMFGSRTVRVRFNHNIIGVRADPADQFTFSIRYEQTGNLATYNLDTEGSNLSRIIYTSTISPYAPITYSQIMKAGSANTLSAYRTVISCSNQITSSPTIRPQNMIGTSYTFPFLTPGDVITCNFNNSPFPRLRLTKSLGAAGRAIADDQFTLNVTQGGSTIATTTTTGTGSSITDGTTPWVQRTVDGAGNAAAVVLGEAASGTTVLDFYTSTMACTNANGSSSTPLPNTVGGTITPKLGDVVTCTITNTAKPATVTLIVTKTMAVVSDPVNGTTNPKAIPGAVIRYTTTVTNTGQASVDASTLVITDPLPPNMTPFVGNPAVTFADGIVPSGLAFDPAADTSFSSEIGGGAPFTAAPAPDSNGYDGNIRGLRIAPTGTMAGRTVAGQPSFTVSFLAQVN